MVYYAIALALYMSSSTREVLRCLLEGLRWLWGAEAVKVAGRSGISQARTRLGAAPLHRLYEQGVRPIATHATKQPVDEVLVQSERRSKRIFTTIRAGMALWATRTMMRASYGPLLVGSRTRKHQPRATASFGGPAPLSRRISRPRLCPATWIR